MAWTGAGFGQFPSYGTAPEDPLRYFHGGEGDEEEDNEDFYGDEDNNYQDPSTTNSSAHPDNYSSEATGVMSATVSDEVPPNHVPEAAPQQQTEEDKKATDRRKLEELRARLLSKRQNTPAKALSDAAASRPETPSKQTTVMKRPPTNGDIVMAEDSSNDVFGVDSLIAESKAAAEASTANASRPQPKEQEQTEVAPPSNAGNHRKAQLSNVSLEAGEIKDKIQKSAVKQSKPQPAKFESSNTTNTAIRTRPEGISSFSNNSAQRENAPSRPLSAASTRAGAERPVPSRKQSSVQDTEPRPTHADARSAKEVSQQRPGFSTVNKETARPEEPKTNQIVSTQDDYYADLGAWLEITGYHDVQLRESKLKRYKKRKAMEEQKRALEEQIAKMEAEEEAELALPQSVRPVVPAMAPPPLPATLPMTEHVQPLTPTVAKPITPAVTNGVKRQRSPEPVPIEKARRRDDEGGSGFRIRGVVDSPDQRPPSSRCAGSPGPGPLERRISFPERRRSHDNGYARDPSLERRQAYYRQPRDRELSPPRQASAFDPYTPRERDRTSGYDRGRGGGYNSTRGGYRGRPGNIKSEFAGSAGLDLRRGGVRYFMIKSWNHENVLNAMRDGLWATQEKNEQLLTDAFNTSRHVILLFSVNKSMAFQGYALMTSPPTPSLPKPPFCAKLNWPTSPAFRIDWFATTPVHFRLVGHLKNNLNIDDRGEPRAVLVGKDGQEIGQDAGMGVCWVLDEVEQHERANHASAFPG